VSQALDRGDSKPIARPYATSAEFAAVPGRHHRRKRPGAAQADPGDPEDLAGRAVDVLAIRWVTAP
jgi:hypothetical protein